MHAALMYLHNSCQHSCIRANETHGFGKEMATTAPDAHKRTCKVITVVISIRELATTEPDPCETCYAR